MLYQISYWSSSNHNVNHFSKPFLQKNMCKVEKLLFFSFLYSQFRDSLRLRKLERVERDWDFVFKNVTFFEKYCFSFLYYIQLAHLKMHLILTMDHKIKEGKFCIRNIGNHSKSLLLPTDLLLLQRLNFDSISKAFIEQALMQFYLKALS